MTDSEALDYLEREHVRAWLNVLTDQSVDFVDARAESYQIKDCIVNAGRMADDRFNVDISIVESEMLGSGRAVRERGRCVRSLDISSHLVEGLIWAFGSMAKSPAAWIDRPPTWWPPLPRRAVAFPARAPTPEDVAAVLARAAMRRRMRQMLKHWACLRR